MTSLVEIIDIKYTLAEFVKTAEKPVDKHQALKKALRQGKAHLLAKNVQRNSSLRRRMKQ